MKNFKPERDPAKRKCKACGAPGATRWDGGMGGLLCRADGTMTPIAAAQYICVDCDSRHKWFDLEDEDFEPGDVATGLPPEHQWEEFPGGPPSDTWYEWCAKCGTLKLTCAGEPDEYRVVGSKAAVSDAPPCSGHDEQTLRAACAVMDAVGFADFTWHRQKPAGAETVPPFADRLVEFSLNLRGAK